VVKTGFVQVAVSVLCLIALAPTAQTPPPVYRGDRTQLRTDVDGFVGWVPNQIIVQLGPSANQAVDPSTVERAVVGIGDIDALSRAYGAVAMERQFPGAKPERLGGRHFDLSAFYRLTFAGPVDVGRVAALYENLPGVERAQTIGVHALYAVPNDGQFASQWHLDNASGADIEAPPAWDIETGSEDIVVAVLDSGVRYFHKDLGGADASYANPTAVDGNVWVNWAEKNGAPGVDDDGNGYVDDWIGWDWVDGASPCWSGEDCNTADNDPRDFNGHGTHCAGNVAAINNNDYAGASIAGGWGEGTLQSSANGVRVMACRIGWSSRLSLQEVGRVRMDFAAQALYYAADNGAKIASCSWNSSDSGGLGAAVDYFIASGGLVFHAAGNDDSSTPDYLGERADVINVAATDRDDCKADFSNHGTWIDVCAPGVEVLSTWHDHDDPGNDYLAEIDGTSMAAPIAAGVAALVWSQNPWRSATEVRQILEDSCDDIDGLSCNVRESGELGAGRVNARAAAQLGAATAVADAGTIPSAGVLMVNYPNPFNPLTTLRFRLDRPGFATLEVFDVGGRRVETLIAASLPAGEHAIVWHAGDVGSGVYFARLVTDGRTTSRRLVLLK
jgi:subtilisin family serine protease